MKVIIRYNFRWSLCFYLTDEHGSWNYVKENKVKVKYTSMLLKLMKKFILLIPPKNNIFLLKCSQS